MFKTRSQPVAEVLWPSPGYKSDNASGSPSNPYVFPGFPAYFARQEWINGSNGKQNWNDFQHACRSTTISNATVTIEQSAGAGYYWWDNVSAVANYNGIAGNSGFGSLPVLNQDVVLANYAETSEVPVVYMTAGARRACIQKMLDILPGFQNQGQIPNDLIEIKDFASLPRTLKKFSSLGKDLRNLFNLRIPDISWKRYSKKVADVWSDTYLQWKFAISPTLQDVLLIKDALKKVDDKLGKLIRDQRKFIVSHRNVDVAGFYPSKQDYYTERSAFRLANYSAWRNIDYLIAEAHVTMDYGYDLGELSYFQLRARALADDLGFNLDPSIIWNAIPWSFVVDWLVNVGSFLQQFAVKNFEPNVNIYRSCMSLHVQRRIGITFQIINDHRPSWSGYVGSMTDHVYTRLNQFPTTLELATSGLDVEKYKLLLALVTSKLTAR